MSNDAAICIRSHPLRFAVLVLALLLPGCGGPREPRTTKITVEEEASLPRDSCGNPMGDLPDGRFPNFSEKYGVSLTLPMPEDAFLALLDDLGLEFEGRGGSPDIEIRNRHPVLSPPAPYQVRDYDLSCVSHAYVIYGGYTPDDWHISYQSYISPSRELVYIEAFYSSPPMP